jgi:predicted AAA+ superfamily ATPase
LEDSSKRRNRFYTRKKQKLPIEVKYSTEIKGKDRKALIKFCEKYKCNKTVIATKDQMKREKIKGVEIIDIPIWLLLIVKELG